MPLIKVCIFLQSAYFLLILAPQTHFSMVVLKNKKMTIPNDFCKIEVKEYFGLLGLI